MTDKFNINNDQITINRQILYHFYPGIIITLFYVLVSEPLVSIGYPGLTALLLAEIFVLAPVGLTHLFWKGKSLNGKFSLKNVVYYTKQISLKQYLIWSLIGIVACFLIYIPLYPIGLYIKENLFSWLPEWYFDPGFGTSDSQLIAKVFLFGIFIDGIIGPVVEELFFRGYLLPRMAYLRNWAPVLNGLLFGLYHFWQPHNYVAITAIGIILSWIVWKKQNVYLGIIIHCSINIMGAIAGYMAATGGNMIPR